MTAADISGVVPVAAAAFPDHFEDRACFEERLALFSQGGFVLADGDVVKGYLIAYPWPHGKIPPLNSRLGGVPDTTETLYLHDLALHPDVRGQGHARPIVERLVESARAWGAERIALVSVNGTRAFWQGFGFEPVTDDPAITQKLASYGDGALYMVKGIANEQAGVVR
ncbi:GNAT family N-acetyltransferase [Sphingoaurantiacus capsulatus]|uniref:GNAT family N-acetyltransferase n=1 Tax=Sphingoaurantiacus capsulatus TaxID=1771310 RepID=A0ABV7X788_9SPHN